MCEEAETIAINVKSTENKTQKKVQSVSDLLKAKLTSSNIPTSDQTVSNPSTTNQDATSTCENDHPVSRSNFRAWAQLKSANCHTFAGQ